MEDPLEDHVNDGPHEEVPDPEKRKPLRREACQIKNENGLSSAD